MNLLRALAARCRRHCTLCGDTGRVLLLLSDETIPCPGCKS